MLLTDKNNWNLSQKFNVGKQLILANRVFNSQSLKVECKALTIPKEVILKEVRLIASYICDVGAIEDDVFNLNLGTSKLALTVVTLTQQLPYTIRIENLNSFSLRVELATLKRASSDRKNGYPLNGRNTSGINSIDVNPVINVNNYPSDKKDDDINIVIN